MDNRWPLQDDDHDVNLQLHTDYDEFINYAGFDKDEDAFQELMSFTNAKSSSPSRTSQNASGNWAGSPTRAVSDC